jgi:hypothetical protein
MKPHACQAGKDVIPAFIEGKTNCRHRECRVIRYGRVLCHKLVDPKMAGRLPAVSASRAAPEGHHYHYGNDYGYKERGPYPSHSNIISQQVFLYLPEDAPEN